MFRLYCLASGRALVGAYPRRGGPFVSHYSFGFGSLGFNFVLSGQFLDPGCIYIIRYILVSRGNCGRESFRPETPEPTFPSEVCMARNSGK